MKHVVNDILEELLTLSARIDGKEIDRMADALYEAKLREERIFIAGAGRSGCIARAFANRLMHLGFSCYLTGDVITPAIRKQDHLFILSGSGKTPSLIAMAEKASSLQADILTMTLHQESDIAKLASVCIVLPGNTRLQKKDEALSFQPVGSCFEQLSWLTCDALIVLLRDKLGLSNEELLARHANLE